MITITKTWIKINKLKYISFLAFLLLAFLIAKEMKLSRTMPLPTGDTIINEEMESAKLGLNKEKWFDLIHNAAPGTDWKSIEAANRNDKIKVFRENPEYHLKDNTINVAGGSIIAQWNEKGSNNLAGSIVNMEYDTLNKILYAISAGGSLWKSTADGLNWLTVSDQLVFDKDFLEIVYPGQGRSRIVCSHNGKTSVSEEGLEWNFSSGPQLVYGGKVKNALSIAEGRHIFYLLDEGPLRNIKLLYSSDYGNEFKTLHSFSTSDLRNISMDYSSSGRLIIMEQVASNRSNLYSWSAGEDQITLFKAQSPLAFGENGRANIKVRNTGTAMHFYCYDQLKRFYRSSDNGISWQLISNLPADPWEEGIFISRSNPAQMILAEVEAHISKDSGKTWTRINKWTDYYNDPVRFLHADIMHIDELEGFANSSPIAIASHGGINMSYDRAVSNINIGLFNLNVGQYYSVRTHPKKPEYVFAGSQDQGIQRGLDLDEGTVGFTQMFSGDYGHICFTHQGQSMWAVYPGGWVFFFPNPITQNFPSKNFKLEHRVPDIWLPALIESPYNMNSVLLAGGNTNASGKSHILSISISDFGGLSVEQWPYDFSNSGGHISAMAYNRFFSNIFYVASSNGKFYKSNDSGRTFSNMSQSLNAAHYLYGHEILCSKSDPNVIYLAGSGYSNSPVFKSTDGGQSFHSIQYNLPSTTVFDLDMDSEGEFIFAATEAGPYVFIEKQKSWFDLSQYKAPMQSYWSVEFLQTENKLRFGSYGRGIWDLDFNILTNVAEFDNQAAYDIEVYPNPSRGELNISSDKHWGQLQIINAQGKLMQQLPDEDLQVKIDISHYPDGVYYIIFGSGNNYLTRKIIKI